MGLLQKGDNMKTKTNSKKNCEWKNDNNGAKNLVEGRHLKSCQSICVMRTEKDCFPRKKTVKQVQMRIGKDRSQFEIESSLNTGSFATGVLLPNDIA